MEKQTEIRLLREQETINFAALELRRYLRWMANGGNGTGNGLACVSLRLGLLQDFGIELRDLADPDREDAIYIDVTASEGVISGSNPRSVLFAVYRFLEIAGCRWLRPGKEGEIVPFREISDLSAHIVEKAFNRFRGISNCGVYSVEQYLDVIDWMPKAGLNSLLNEGFITKHPFDSWYNRSYHSLNRPAPRSGAEIMSYNNEVIREVKKRGLLFHSAGHGWPGLFFGLPVIHSEDGDMLLKKAAEKPQYLAMHKGERSIRGGNPKLIELCYSNPEVRSRMVRCAADYAESHPEVDALHFWLSDALNADCECELCMNTRPADFYIIMLNGIDDELTRRGIKTKIVFLIYHSLQWPPEKERILNPDRFIMMYTFGVRKGGIAGTAGADVMAQMPVYKRNGFKPPLKSEGYLASLKAWRKCFNGEAFAFDYYMVWYHFFDPGYYTVAEDMADAVKKLAGLGLDGMISCQIMCTSFPTGMPNYLRARLLWNPCTDKDRLISDYFDVTFGADGRMCLEYMKGLSDSFSPEQMYLREVYLKQDEKPENNADEDMEAILRLSDVPKLVEGFRPVIERNVHCVNKFIAKSWEYLFIHSELVLLLAYALRARISGQQQIADAYWQKATDYVMVNEKRLESIFDFFWFYLTFERSHKMFKSQSDKNIS